MTKSPKTFVAPLDPIEQPLAQARPEFDHGDTVAIEVPLCRDTPPVGFCVHLDARLTLEQSTALRKTAAALDKAQARLASGKRVVGSADAVKYILERLADAAG